VLHHEQALAFFRDSQAASPDTLGVVVVGSVARGDERPDSDVDVYLVVTEQAYQAAVSSGRVAYVSRSGVRYDGGYIDVKLASPGYLRAAVDHGDDPTRASFAGGRVVLDRLGDLEQLVGQMADLSPTAWAERVRTYRAQLALYGGYFLVQAADRGDRFLLQHSAVHAAMAAGRCALAQHHRLFRGQKYLAADLGRLTELPDGFLDAWSALLETPTAEAARTLTAIVDGWLGDPLTGDEALSTFIATNELGWLTRTIPPEYW
jgi:predicted nucleotidyltransferase